MDPFILGLWVISISLLIVSLIKRKEETFKSFKKSKKMMQNMIPQIVSILIIIGYLMALFPQEVIKNVLGEDTVVSTILAALVGAITIIPAFVAFPLVGSLVDQGASIVVGVSFLTTLTMVGIATFPIEKQEFGLKFTLIRNIMSFVFAIIIALVMGVLL